MERNLKMEKGLTVIEICIAIFIIGLTALVITGFTKNSLMMQNNARGSETAYLSAQRKLADLTASPFPVNGNDKDTIEGKIFSRSWVVSISGLVTIADITVQWTSMKGNAQVRLAGAIK
jgi:Tfp pilus assembly protein PilV